MMQRHPSWCADLVKERSGEERGRYIVFVFGSVCVCVCGGVSDQQPGVPDEQVAGGAVDIDLVGLGCVLRWEEGIPEVIGAVGWDGSPR